MPRTTTLDCPGCPPLRALTFDSLGLIKVTESRSREGEFPKVVEKWGEIDKSKCVLAASIDDSKLNPLLAIARKCGNIEVLNPLNGDLRVAISSADDVQQKHEDDDIIGLHLFRKQRSESESGSCTLLSCSTKGNAIMRSIEVTNSPTDSANTGSSRMFSVCPSGSICFSKVDGSENYALFGGKRVEVNMWDLDKCVKIWTAKSPPKDSLGIFTSTWFTSAAFLTKDDHRKFVAGTNNHKVQIYDMASQRRPVMSFDFKETPIMSVAEDLDGHRIYIGNGSGDLATVDTRTGTLVGCFFGKCSGSIRSIARHPQLPVLASCGLDGYLRFWDTQTRQLLSSVFLKQKLTNVVFDSNFADEVTETASSTADPPPLEAPNVKEIQIGGEEETLPVKRKKAAKQTEGKKKKASKVHNKENDILKPKQKKKRVKDRILDDEE